MSQIRKIGGVGAGNMGSGIARKIARGGLSVVMVDTSAAAVRELADTAAWDKYAPREFPKRFVPMTESCSGPDCDRLLAGEPLDGVDGKLAEKNNEIGWVQGASDREGRP